MKPAAKLITILAAFFAAYLAFSVPPGAAQEGGEWTRLGAVPSGAWSVAYDSQASAVYALGPEGILKSADGGTVWTACLPAARTMRLLTPLPGQEGSATLYAVTPTGLHRSADGCATWSSVSTEGVNPSGAHIRWLAPYPNNYDVLYAGMDGLGGLYRSTDAGATWQPARGLPPGSWVTALTADPRNPASLFAGVRYATRHATPAYVFRSTDGGVTWRSSSLGMSLLPNNDGYVTGIAWSGETLFAATSHEGLFKSTDRGATWQQANLPRRTDAQPQIASPANLLPLQISSLMSNWEGVLLINTSQGAYQSLDGGQSWRNFGPSGAQGDRLLVAMDMNTATVLLAGANGAWTTTIPQGIASLPTATPEVVADLPPTPPPPPEIPTLTPIPPTPTQTPIPTPTIALVEGPLPTDRAEPLDPAISDYFPETGHNIKYGFRDYWRSIDGIRLLGYPLTEEFVENGVTVQYFERARLEYRDGRITWGLLGVELTRGQFFRPVPFFPSTETRVYFGPTQHSLSGPFLQFWRQNGGLNTFGYPISEDFQQGDREYQWFERARFEWHPDLPASQRIVLGQLGREALQKRGWIR